MSLRESNQRRYNGVVALHCDCRIMANTLDCGSRDRGSIPLSHPILHYIRRGKMSITIIAIELVIFLIGFSFGFKCGNESR